LLKGIFWVNYNMRRLFLLLFSWIPVFALSQFSGGSPPTKQVIDFAAIESWRYVGGGQISDRGDFALYFVSNPNGENKFVIASTDLKWRQEFPFAAAGEFADNGKFACIKFGNDSLCLLALKTAKSEIIHHLLDFQICHSNNAWMAIRLNEPKGTLLLRRLDGSTTFRADSVTSYQFSETGNSLLFTSGTGNDQAVNLIDFSTGTRRRIWRGARNENAFHFAFSHNGRQIAFIVDANATQPGYSIWYFSLEMPTAVQLLSDSLFVNQSEMRIGQDIPQFDMSDSGIYFKMNCAKKVAADANSLAMDIWSTKSSSFLLEPNENQRTRNGYGFFIDLATREVRRIEGENEQIQARTNGWALVEQGRGEVGTWEAPWNTAGQLCYYLVSTKDGSKHPIKDHVLDYKGAVNLSPGGKWAIYFEKSKETYCSYEIATGLTRTLTSKLETTWIDEKDDYPDHALAGPVKWLGTDDAMLIEDNYDIWLIDPRGAFQPVNITENYGRSQNIKFTILNTQAELSRFSLDDHPVLLLGALNNYSKDYGFFTKALGDSGAPILRSIGPYCYQTQIKATQSGSYLLLRETAESSPNYFITSNFKEFIRLSDIHPEAQYNWLTTELIHWQEPNGDNLAGILYKPGNFDPNKKYPVIFTYYERMSENLHLFPTPKLSQGALNIAWFVSAGYIVFAPDIRYKIGEPGASACDAIVSAAHNLAKMSFIDSTRMGLEGHSFGGYETIYIISHSQLFAAACSAAGVCDLVSMYGSGARGMFPLFWAERFQGRMGGTPWQIPEKYISNSPLFSADKITTPILIMHNKGDDVVPFSQALQLFTALRRLGKQAWLVQYDDGGHEVYGKSAADFTIKLTGYFNHFLQRSPLPVWMEPDANSGRK
jgi:dipeptidyl aminopeptidase/acylaminoacyl peptidase